MRNTSTVATPLLGGSETSALEAARSEPFAENTKTAGATTDALGLTYSQKLASKNQECGGNDVRHDAIDDPQSVLCVGHNRGSGSRSLVGRWHRGDSHR
jgi:hypothetical protein